MMKKLLAILLVLILVFSTTGCSIIYEVLQEESKTHFEDITIDSAEEAEDVLDEYLENREEAEKEEKQEEKEPILDIGEIFGKNKLTPTIEYRGVTYYPHMTVTDEELYEWIPDIELGENTDAYIGNMVSDLYFDVRLWEKHWTSPRDSMFIGDLKEAKETGKYIASMQIEKEGASSNGVYIGDSENLVFEKLKIDADKYVENRGEDSYYICLCFFEEELYTSEEWGALRKSPLDPEFEEEPIMYEKHQFQLDYNSYSLWFRIQDGRVESINMADGRWLRWGS